MSCIKSKLKKQDHLLILNNQENKRKNFLLKESLRIRF